MAQITEKVRAKLIVNTTTALAGHKARQAEHRDGIPAVVHRHLDDLVAALAAQRKTRAGKKDYDFLVYPYFRQLSDVLRECHRASKIDAPLHLMVADAALYGVHVDTPQILARILAAIGFRSCACHCVRLRGHRWILDKRDGSKQGLGEYHVRAVK